MEKNNVEITNELDLCISCEICHAVCPYDAITFILQKGKFIPKIDIKKCTNCGLCLKLCPGIDLDPDKIREKPNQFSDSLIGPIIDCYTAYCNNPDIRSKSTSGGLITSLIINLLEDKIYDSAFVLQFDRYKEEPARLKEIKKPEEIINSSKSKYIPASIYNVIKTINENREKKYIIVGTPCQIYGLKKFLKHNKISENNYLFLGLFCDKTLNYNLIKFYEKKYKNRNEKIEKFLYRTKEKNGWPGDTKIFFNSGRSIIINRSLRMKLKKFFQVYRCLFCLDKLNKHADISFGDCYLPMKKDINGKSNIIVRTKKGEEILDKYSNLYFLEKEYIKPIYDSQFLDNKKKNLEYAKTIIETNKYYPNVESNVEKNNQNLKELKKLKKHIKLGERNKFYRIKTSIFYENASYIFKTLITTMSYFLTTLKLFLSTSHKKTIKVKKGENVIIVGGELYNKGAQAMTFTTVDQIKRIYPKKDIYLFSSLDYSRDENEKNQYNFIIRPWDIITKYDFLKKTNKKILSKELKQDIEKILQNTCFIIDISGFALSSNFHLLHVLNYILNIMIAKKYDIPFYILPQSFGPFKFKFYEKILLYPLMKNYLKYANKIFAREKEGLRYLQSFSKNNIEKSYDIVLQFENYKFENIFNKKIQFKDIDVKDNSVGIIPNSKVFERIKSEDFYSLYKYLINNLLSQDKNVYILRHSYEDLHICEKIKELFKDNSNVFIISDDLNAIQLEKIIKKFDFIIGSRYHSIIHAYKNKIPAISIGWAVKYEELLSEFDQLDYYCDVRKNFDIKEIVEKNNKMLKSFNKEKKVIEQKLGQIFKYNTFKIIFTNK